MSVESTQYFVDTQNINSVFAGDLTQNLIKAASQLDVQLIARDSWVRIIAEDKRCLQRTVAFIDALKDTFKSNSKNHSTALTQAEFDHLLQTCRENRENELQEFFSERVKVSSRKKDIVPRNRNQLEYLRSIRSKDIVFGLGPAGTGKTYLAMAMAVTELLSEQKSRIILTRPVREAGENLGFLPGTLEEKIRPYLRPLFDALYDMLEAEELAALMEKNVIEVAPLAFMRGRTLNNAFVILDEAQNTTKEQMFMFLTRLGFNSHCIITGDASQTDLPKNVTSGLVHAVKVLKKIPEIGFSYFNNGDIVRHALIEKIIDAYHSPK